EGEINDEEDKIAVSQQFPDGGGGTGGRCSDDPARGVAEKTEQRNGVDHSHDPRGVEGPAPAEGGSVGDVAGVSSEDETYVDTGLMNPHGAGPGPTEMKIGDEGEGGGDVKGLADPHEGAGRD